MSEQMKIRVNCSCARKEKFEHTIQTKPGSKKKRSLSLQVECPYSDKEGCHKMVSILIDIDNEMEDNRTIMRHGS